MNQVTKYLKDAKTYYLATMENDQPHVRPFGSLAEVDGKIYICTANNKNVYQQILNNPQIEISCMVGGTWLRLQGKLHPDHRQEAKAAFLEAMPEMKKMYSVDDGIFEVLYLSDFTATVYSFTDAPKDI
ncbi:MAG: pyridoxamine 5'-phosphate oxidase family protein, partial [Clostridiales bacterium]